MSGGNKIFILCEYEYAMLSPSVMNKKIIYFKRKRKIKY